METEIGRLEKLYAELGDEHLKDLAEEPENLTDEARLALEQEMRRRGFQLTPHDGEAAEQVLGERETGFGAGIPGVFPTSAAVMEQALEPGGEQQAGMTSLISFYDGLELAKACAILDDAEIEPFIQQVDGDAMSGAPPRYEIWLDPRDIEGAKRLLRVKMGLFPAQEVELESDAADPGTMVTLGDFETIDEAKRAAALLTAAGIEHRIVSPDQAEDAGDDEDDQNAEAMYRVEVPSEDLDRGLDVVATGMGLG
jgi:hypothetical protein